MAARLNSSAYGALSSLKNDGMEAHNGESGRRRETVSGVDESAGTVKSMLKRVVLTAVGTLAVAGTVLAQTPEKVEFGRDVLPIFRQHCVGCHGPSQQISGLRVDQRSSAMKGGTRRIVPGGSENSFVYLKLITDEYGLRMPPTGRMKPEEIAVIKAWIDQGAEWPDSLANDAPVPPVNPKAVAMIDRLRAGDRRSFMKMVAEDP